MRSLILLLIFLSIHSVGQDFPARPVNYITDDVGALNQQEKESLNAKLKSFEDNTGHQLFIYLANSLNEKDIRDYTLEIFRVWQPGSKEKDNGILITVFIQDHQFRIITGYGLQKTLPPALLKQIQENDMRPSFKAGNYYEGLDKGVNQLISYSNIQTETHWGIFIFFYGFSAILLGITLWIAYKVLKERPKRRTTITVLSIVAFLIPFIGCFILIAMLFITLAHKSANAGNIQNSAYASDPNYYDSYPTPHYNSSSSADNDSGSSDFAGGGGGDSDGSGSSSDW